MNYIRHLTGFFDRVCKDHRLNPTHISIYMAIFQFWNVNRFKNPLSISRNEIMELSKVSSKNTYHKCMKELHQFGYFRYDPSYHPLRGSWVYLYFFATSGIPDQYKNQTSSELVADKLETGDVQAEDGLSLETHDSTASSEPLNRSKHIKLSKLLSLAERRDSIEKLDLVEAAGEIKNGSASEKNAITASPETMSTADRQVLVVSENKPENEEQVIHFFQQSAYPRAQALKFFHYYSSTGWKLGGKTPIENWRSAAHSWMLHAQNTTTHGSKPEKISSASAANHLHAATDKNYSEPL